MKIIGLIPARLSASRFDKKLLKDLCGKPVIVRTYEAVVNTKIFHSVYVITDSDEILKVIKQINGNCIISNSHHDSGSDRIAEASNKLEADAFVNIQGDEPFIDSNSLKKICFELKFSDYVSIMIKISESEADNPNNVKVVVDKNNFAMYFSRSKIPYNRDSVECSLFKHIGVYGFKKKSLLDFAKLPSSKLEVVEKIEAIRILENGFKLKMIETDFLGIGIDTVEDLIFARTKWLNK